MMDPNPLLIATRAKSDANYIESKADIIEFYQEKYKGRGKESWKQHLIHDLSAQTGIKTKSLEKRFDTQRRNNPETRNAAQYQELGKTLPPMGYKPKGGEITITIEGSQGQRDRGPWTVTFKGPDAYSFVNDPTYYKIFRAMGYEKSVIEMFDGDDSGALSITSVS